jgi:DNA gyrase/topoisomerase IV subunit A
MSYPPGYVEERIQILDAIGKAIDQRVEVVRVIAATTDENEAISALQEMLGTTESGARAVLETQLRRLMITEREKIVEQLEEMKSQL